MLYLCLLLALLLQTICSLGFASASYARQTDPIKKAVLFFGTLTFATTVTIYALMWANHLWLIPYNTFVEKPSELSGWLFANLFWLSLAHFLLWTWSFSMFIGAIVLSSSHIEAGKILIGRNTILDRLLKFAKIEITNKTNICNLSWKVGVTISAIPIMFIIFLYWCLIMIFLGVAIFIFAGKNPLIPIGAALKFGDYDYRSYRLGKIPIVPIVPIAIGFMIWLGFKLPAASFLYLLAVLTGIALIITMIVLAVKYLKPKIERSMEAAAERRLQKRVDRIMQKIYKPVEPSKPRQEPKPKIERPNLILILWSILKGKACLQVGYDSSTE